MTIMNIIIECARDISMYIFKCSVVSLSLSLRIKLLYNSNYFK